MIPSCILCNVNLSALSESFFTDTFKTFSKLSGPNNQFVAVNVHSPESLNKCRTLTSSTAPLSSRNAINSSILISAWGVWRSPLYCNPCSLDAVIENSGLEIVHVQSFSVEGLAFSFQNSGTTSRVKDVMPNCGMLNSTTPDMRLLRVVASKKNLLCLRDCLILWLVTMEFKACVDNCRPPGVGSGMSSHLRRKHFSYSRLKEEEKKRQEKGRGGRWSIKYCTRSTFIK